MKAFVFNSFLIASLGAGSALGAIHVDVTSGYVFVGAEDTIDGSAIQLDPAGFGIDGLTRAAVDGSAIAEATYKWTNHSGQASFEASAHQQIEPGGYIIRSIQEFSFTLSQTANFSLSGGISGEADDMGDLSYLEVRLHNDDTNQFVGAEIDSANLATFHQAIDGIQQGNSFFSVQGQLAGTIGPGRYSFFGLLLLRDDGDLVGDMHASGFTRLTLSDPHVDDSGVPEPSTLAIWGFSSCGCAIVAYRRRRVLDRWPKHL